VARDAARRRGARSEATPDEQLDLLTAALLGAAIGAAAGFILRPRPRHSRLVSAVERAERSGRDVTRQASKKAGRFRKSVGSQASEGADWVRDRLSPRDPRPDLSRYMGEARERISDAVEEELRDLRRAIRRQRRKLGV
jgi:gas vesicle protein